MHQVRRQALTRTYLLFNAEFRKVQSGVYDPSLIEFSCISVIRIFDYDAQLWMTNG